MEKVYVIIQDNGYDGFETPYNDQFYTNEQRAEQDCKALNNNQHSNPFWVLDLTLKK